MLLRYLVIIGIFLYSLQTASANIDDPHFNAEWDSLQTLCGKAFFYGSLNEAAQYAETLYQMNLQKQNDSLTCLALMFVSTVINDPVKVTKAFEDAIKAAERFGNMEMLISTKGNFAINRFTIGDIRQAYVITKELQLLADSLNNNLALEQASLNMAQIYDYTGESQKSIEQLQTLLRVLPQNDHNTSFLSLRSAQTYSLIARCYGNMNVTDSAFYYIQKALHVAHKEQLSDMLLRGYIQLAELYGMPPAPTQSALHSMRTALDSASRHQTADDWMLLNELKVTEAKYLMLSGQAARCVKMLLPLLSDVEKAEDLQTLRSFREILVQAYSQLNQYDQAFKNLQALTILNDSIAQNEISGQLAIYEVDKQTKEKELENLDLRRKNELAQQRSQLILIGGIIALLLAVAALIFARRSYLQSQKNKILNTKLTHINSRLERFVSTISHDVLSNLDLLLSWGRVMMHSKPAQMNLENYYTQSHLIHTQIKDYCLGLLKESRIASVNSVEAYYDPNEIVKKVIQRFDSPLRATGFKVISEPLSYVQIPPVITEQIFQNLISNAIRYAGTSSAPMIRIAEMQDVMKRKQWIVEDNGPGVPQENKVSVFQKAEQASAKGQGIGLSLLKSNLNEYGWNIWVEDRDGGGARFVIATT